MIKTSVVSNYNRLREIGISALFSDRGSTSSRRCCNYCHEIPPCEFRTLKDQRSPEMTAVPISPILSSARPELSLSLFRVSLPVLLFRTARIAKDAPEGRTRQCSRARARAISRPVSHSRIPIQLRAESSRSLALLGRSESSGTRRCARRPSVVQHSSPSTDALGARRRDA